MKCWIFVSIPYSDYNKGTILEMAKNLKQSAKWRIGKRTGSRTQLAKGDKVLFYQAGEGGKKFVGTATILSDLQISNEEIFDLITIGDIEFWRKAVPARNILGKLSFIKNKNKWGVYFKGGIIKISEEDYNTILNKSKKNNISLGTLPLKKRIKEG
jgi:hypothetical protein